MEAILLVKDDGSIHEFYTHYLVMVALTFVPLPKGETEDDVDRGRIVVEFIDGNTRNKKAKRSLMISRTVENIYTTVPFLDRVVYCGANTLRIKRNKAF